MESIAVTEPNMTVTRQEALSPFGLLSELFTEELVRRNSLSPGFYRPMSLVFLDESEGEAAPAPPEIHFDLNVDLVFNRLLKEIGTKEQKETKPQTPAERILERVILRERELRTARSETRRIVIETGGRRYAANAPVRNTAPERKVDAGSAAKERVTLQPGEKSLPASAASPRSTTQAAPSVPAMIKAKPVSAASSAERRLVGPGRALPLASRILSVPSAGGWTPQQRELHPGYPVRTENKQSSVPEAGSILLPDVLRRRREEAIERSRMQGAFAEAQESRDALEDALTWSTEGAEQSPQTVRVIREVRRAVEETLRRSAKREEAQPAAPAGSEKDNTQTHSIGSRRESRELPAYARAHTHYAQAEEGGSAQSTGNTESEAPMNAVGTAAPAKAGHTREPGRVSADTDEAQSRETAKAQTAEQQAVPLNADQTGTASEIPVPVPAISAVQDAMGTASELVYREGAEYADPFAANAARPSEAREGSAPSAAIPVIREGYRDLAGESTAAAGEDAAADTISAAETDHSVPQPAARGDRPEIPAPEAVPAQASEAPSAPAGTVYISETQEAGPRSAVRIDKPETPAPAAIPAEASEAPSAPAETVYISETQEAVPQSAAHSDRPETPAPASIPAQAPEAPSVPAGTVLITGSEYSGPHPAARTDKPEMPAPEAIPAEAMEIPSAPAETVFITETQETGRQPEGPAPIPEQHKAEARPAVQTAPEPGTHTETVSEETTEIPAPHAAPAAETFTEATAEKRDAGEYLAVPAAEDVPEAPAELIHREEAIAAARTDVVPKAYPDKPAGPEYRADRTPARTDTEGQKAETAARADSTDAQPSPAKTVHITGAKETVPRPAARTDKQETALSSAIPSDIAEAASVPVETVYVTEAEDTLPQPSVRADKQEKPLAAAIPADTAEAASAPSETVFVSEASADRPYTEADHTKGESPARPKSAIPSAIPANEAGRPSGQAAIVYRTQEPEASPRQTEFIMGKTAEKTPKDTLQGVTFPVHGGADRQPPKAENTPRRPMTYADPARDIRVAAEQGIQPFGASHRGIRKASGAANSGAARGDIPSALPADESSDAAMPPELVFAAPAQGTEPPADPTVTAKAKPPQSDRTEMLPDWAKELMEKAGVSDTAMRSAAFGGGSEAPQPGQVTWTAPGAAMPRQSAQNGPAELSFKERAAEEQDTVRQQQISDAEIQRTADRVYKLIEERLRRELRRSGR